AVVPNSTLTACLTTCDANGSQPCDMAAPTGQGSINGTTFGPPLPVVVQGVGVCVVSRWNRDPSGSVDPLTGDTALQTNLSSGDYVTSTSQVCPRCASGTCDSGANQGGSCTVESTITVAGASGNNVYNLSSECLPTASQLRTAVSLCAQASRAPPPQLSLTRPTRRPARACWRPCSAFRRPARAPPTRWPVCRVRGR